MLTNCSSVTACKLIDELIETRLFREEKEIWIEKAVITRIWICCTTAATEDILEQLRELFDASARSMKDKFSALATHAAQTVSHHVIGSRLSPTDTIVIAVVEASRIDV